MIHQMISRVDISVIIAIYGVENYIEQSLRAIFSQTKTEGVEFILINDATPDNSMVIARRVIADYPHCDIKIIEFEKNQGVAAVRQTGIDSACGEYILHYDSDDWCEPTMLEELYRAAQESDADMVLCDTYHNMPSNERYIKQQEAPQNGADCMRLTFQRKISLASWDKLFRRSLYIGNNVSYKRDLKEGEDVLTNMELYQYIKKVEYLPKAYLHYRQRGGSLTKQVDEAKIANGINFIGYVEKLLNSYGLSDTYKRELQDWKLRSKLSILTKLIWNNSKYALIYPEADSYISEYKTSRVRRFALQQAAKGRVWLFNLIIGSVLFANKVLGKSEKCVLYK